MGFFNEHPGFVYLMVTGLQLISSVVMAAALVVIAISLRKRK